MANPQQPLNPTPTATFITSLLPSFTSAVSALASHANTAIPNALPLNSTTPPLNEAIIIGSSTDLIFPGGKNLTTFLAPAVALLTLVLEYVKKNPQVLVMFAAPALIVWLEVLGIAAGWALEGVRAGSVAAILQSRIGNVPKNSWFSYLQSYGGKGFARRAIFRGGVYLTLAILIAVAGKALYDSGIGQMYIEPLAEKVWHQMETKLDRRGEVGSGAPGSVATEIRAQ